MKASCEDEWVAKTYSEYLLSCAEAKIELIDSINESGSDDDLQEIIDIWSDYLSDSEDNLKLAIAPWFERASYPSYRIQWSDPEFQEAYRSFANSDAGRAWWNGFSAGISLPGAWTISSYAYQRTTANDDDIIRMQNDYVNRINVLTNNFLSNNGYDANTSFTLNNSCVNLKELYKQVITLNNLDVSNPEISLTATGFSDAALGITKMTLDEFWDETKSNLGSTIAWAEGFASCMIDKASDVITTYKEKLANFFTDASRYINASITTVKNALLTAKGDVSAFIQQADELLGWSKVGDTIETVDETDMFNYSGASPYSDINLKTAKGIAEATGKTVVAAAYIVWEGMKKLAFKINEKIKPYYLAVSNDPEDIGVIDKEADSYSFKNFCFTQKYDSEAVYGSQYFIDLNYVDEFTAIALRNIVAKDLNKWIAYKTISGEYMFRLNVADNPILQENKLRIYFEYQYKPRVIDAVALLNSGLLTQEAVAAPSSGYAFKENLMTPPTDIEALVNNLTTFKMNDYRISDEAYDVQKYVSILLTNLFNYMINKNSLQEVVHTIPFAENICPGTFGVKYNGANTVYQVSKSAVETYGLLGTGTQAEVIMNISDVEAMMSWDYDPQTGKHSNYAWKKTYPTGLSITNADVIKAVCGYNSVDGSFKDLHGLIADNWGSLEAQDIIMPLILIYIFQRLDKYRYPDEYVYIPYSSDNYTFMEPRYKVITDAEHRNVAQVFVNVLVIIAVVATVIIIGAKISKLIKTKKFARLNAKKGAIDNAMWNGTLLPNGSSPTSIKNSKKYMRYTKKLDKMSNGLTGFASSPTASETLNNVSKSLSALTGVTAEDTSLGDDFVIDTINANSTDEVNQIKRLITG